LRLVSEPMRIGNIPSMYTNVLFYYVLQVDWAFGRSISHSTSFTRLEVLP
jgi:hypothetical protein